MGRLRQLPRTQLLGRPFPEVFAFSDASFSTFDWRPEERFADEQESGPYAFWRHTHAFEARGASTLMRDVVDYSEPLGPIGTVPHVLFVRRTLDRIFDFRRDAIERLLGSTRAGQPAGEKEKNHAHVA
jgi:ligand-binding SRPBCC domain-containing protein